MYIKKDIDTEEFVRGNLGGRSLLLKPKTCGSYLKTWYFHV